MEKIHLTKIGELNELLRNNCMFANGKNFAVEHLYGTVAASRWECENIFGVYLTRPAYAWMALWMGFTARAKLKKRGIRYIHPDPASGDAIGRVEIYTDESDLSQVVAPHMFLYFFDPNALAISSVIDLSGMHTSHKVPHLLQLGFKQGRVVRKGEKRQAILPPHGESPMVVVDEWQIALTNQVKVVPDKEVTLGSDVRAELLARMKRTDTEVGERYLL